MVRRGKGASDASRSLVGFLVGGIRYAVPIKHVREITNPMPITLLPNAPPVVVGVADHRGEVITVVDLRVHFGMPPSQQTSREKWILLQMSAEPLGLVVDAVTEVFGTAGQAMRAPPQISRVEQQALLGVLSYEGSLVFVIDVERFVQLVNTVRRESMPSLGAPR